MIRLTISFDTTSKTIIFDKQVVIIGSIHSEKTDLSLPGEELQEEHVKIIEQNGGFFIHNIANDPFVTLNGLPFGKKPLKNRDIIQIGNTSVIFEGEASPRIDGRPPSPPNKEMYTAEGKLIEIVQKAISEKISEKKRSGAPLEEKNSNPTKFEDALWKIPDEDYPNFNLEEEIERLEAYARQREENEELQCEEEDDLDIEALVREAEELEMPSIETIQVELEEESFPAAEPLEKEAFHPHESIDPSPFQIDMGAKPPPQPKERLSLKDYYLGEFDDENENWTIEKLGAKNPYQTTQPANNMRLLWVVLLILIITLSISGGIIYLTLSDKTGQEELKAAKRISDVAMALTYAQVHHINPPKHNWSDPGFLQNNLTAVLSPNYPPISNIDFNGHFSDCPYILRIYTSSDLSQFLVIAQPEPTLLHWLVPKASIIVDSRTMELHKISDLKAINRLLVNSSNLDGTNAVEISNLIKQGDLIPLSTLNAEGKIEGFNAPKALALIRPGAENRIYNAPRYYHLGDSLLKRTILQAEAAGSSHEVGLIQQLMEPLTKYPDIVLYSSLGMQKAMQAQKSLTTFIPQEKFLIAYLVFDSKGEITSSHLLIDQDFSYIALEQSTFSWVGQTPKEMIKTYVTALNSLQDKMFEQKRHQTSEALNNINENHPLYLELVALISKRQQALKPIAEEIKTLLNNDSKSYLSDFKDHFEKLSSEYNKLRAQNTIQLQEGITKLAQEYAHISFSQFLAFAHAAGIEGLLEENLKAEKKSQNPDTAALSNELEGLIKNIDSATNLEDLDKKVKIIADNLTLQQLPDTEKLIGYQNAVRSEVSSKVSKFLLSQESTLQPEAFTNENRAILGRILKTAWVNETAEFDFFMEEFDFHAPQDNKK